MAIIRQASTFCNIPLTGNSWHSIFYWLLYLLLGFIIYLSKQDYGLWNEDDSKNIESLVLEEKNDRKMDNTKLLLDVIPRSPLGYEFSLEKVYY